MNSIIQSKMSASLRRQNGAGHGWMLLTIGIMVGFILGFVLFLSRLPEEHYTLVETERAVEQYKTTDASQFAFYDRLSEVDDAVPNVEADEMPAFNRAENAGRYGAGDNERAGAVQIADELNAPQSVQPFEVAGALAAPAVGGVSQNTISKQQEAKLRQIRQPSVVKKIPNKPATSYYLQAGAFAEDNDAQRMKETLRNSGMDAFIRTVAIDGKKWHRVRIGPFYDSGTLYNAQTKLGRSGISYLVIKVQS